METRPILRGRSKRFMENLGEKLSSCAAGIASVGQLERNDWNLSVVFDAFFLGTRRDFAERRVTFFASPKKVTKERRPRFRVFFAMKRAKKIPSALRICRVARKLTFAHDQARKLKQCAQRGPTNPAVLSAPQGQKIKSSNGSEKADHCGSRRHNILHRAKEQPRVFRRLALRFFEERVGNHLANFRPIRSGERFAKFRKRIFRKRRVQ
jgi:hypothetical protein